MLNENRTQSAQPGIKRRINFQIPGSTSNLGAGFDACALALGIYCRLSVILLDEPSSNIPFITFKGAVARRSHPLQLDKLLYRVLKGIWQDCPEILDRFRLEVDSDIPLGCGLGGSGAIIVGALWGSYMLQERIPSPATLLAEAAVIEGYNESVAASMLGGFVVCARAEGQGIIARRHDWPERWQPIFVVPGYRLDTPDMRSCLPDKVLHSDAAYNIARAALLVSAVAREDDAALKEALHDRMAEPYRASRVPLLGEVRRVCADLPVLGTTLSGGGPAVMVMCKRADRPDVASELEKWIVESEQDLSVLAVEPDDSGITELN